MQQGHRRLGRFKHSVYDPGQVLGLATADGRTSVLDVQLMTCTHHKVPRASAITVASGMAAEPSPWLVAQHERMTAEPAGC